MAIAELVLPKLKHMGYRIAWNHRNGSGVFFPPAQLHAGQEEKPLTSRTALRFLVKILVGLIS